MAVFFSLLVAIGAGDIHAHYYDCTHHTHTTTTQRALGAGLGGMVFAWSDVGGEIRAGVIANKDHPPALREFVKYGDKQG